MPAPFIHILADAFYEWIRSITPSFQSPLLHPIPFENEKWSSFQLRSFHIYSHDLACGWKEYNPRPIQHPILSESMITNADDVLHILKLFSSSLPSLLAVDA